MKKAAVFIMALAITVMLSACSLGLDISENIKAPKAGREQSEIQKALENYAGTDIKLVYPSGGDFRSAITTEDINGDGVEEALAFYSTKTDDKSSVIHLNYIRKTENGWVSVADIKKNAAGVETIEFADFGDGVKRSLVKWQGFTSLDGYISVLEAGPGTLTEMFFRPCSSYLICDFTEDGSNDIVEIYCDAAAKTSTARCVSYGESGFSITSSCALDGGVTAYKAPILTRLKNGSTAIFIDAEKSTGYITEVIFRRQGSMYSAFTVNKSAENTRTFRKSTVLSEDIDGDGSYDIPLADPLPVLEGETEQTFINVWHSYDGLEFNPIAYSLINYTDGYTLFVSKESVGNFTLARDKELKLRVLYRWDAEAGKKAEEICRIRVFSSSEWELKTNVPDGYIELARNDDSVFAVKLGNSALTPTEQYVRDNFKLLSAKGGFSPMKRILIVEDEQNIREFEVINLRRVGYTTVEAGSGEEALRIFDSDRDGFDIALLDISMPGMDGFTLCKELRRRSSELGIIMLTARTQEMDKISGLMLGADDYITKPFSPTELNARVDSLYRRIELHHKAEISLAEEIRHGEFVLNMRRRTLSKNDKNIELTQVEFQIIEYLFTNPDTPLDRNDILTRVWGENYFGEEKIVDVNIRRLRMKIEDVPSSPKHLVTVWGMGYKWSTQ